MGTTSDTVEFRDKLAELTGKQREVLDLLLEHHPIKSIASQLKLSVPAVELRLRDARLKLGVSDSKSAARAYRALLEKPADFRQIYGKSVPTYGNEVVPVPLMFAHQSNQDGIGKQGPSFRDAGAINSSTPWAAELFPPVNSKALLDRFSPLALLAVAAGLAVALAAVVLLLLAMAEQLQDLKIERLFH